ncbi:hypothetical protein FOFC_01358 [Fusarium oxysporum]|nr:hypothetical protein FOFC_01358 [Fusarium oxysporum]
MERTQAIVNRFNRAPDVETSSSCGPGQTKSHSAACQTTRPLVPPLLKTQFAKRVMVMVVAMVMRRESLVISCMRRVGKNSSPSINSQPAQAQAGTTHHRSARARKL